MAWLGEIKRKTVGATQISSESCEILFECLHKQLINCSAQKLIKSTRDFICDTCSKEPRERIKKIQESINFDEVLEKLKELNIES